MNLEPKSFREAGLHFDSNGKLVSIDNGQPFEFFVSPNPADNNKRYHAIGRLVDEYVYDVMEKDLGLRKILIPRDARSNEPTGFFFASENVTTSKYLMIIIHGMGVVRAGQWSRKLIINESLQVGSQLEYIQRALSLGYSVIVTNTNQNIDESPRSIVYRPLPIRGSATAEEHACSVWENFVQRTAARHICIMAHSYGGAVVLELAKRFTSDFESRVFAVALSDSPMRDYQTSFRSNVLKVLKERTINWIAAKKQVDTILGDRDYGQIRSAGHTVHEWTSHTAFQAIFRFFEEQRQKIERLNH